MTSYVPEPRPAQTDFLLSAMYFPGWKQQEHGGWKPLEAFRERTPLLGYYDEGSPEVADWEIKWAVEHGIHAWIYCWFRLHENVGHPLSREALMLDHALHDGLFHARYRKLMRFAIMWENENLGGVSSKQDLLANLLPFWLENYFHHPQYLVVDNKPVLFVFYMPHLVRDLGNAEAVADAMEEMREACRRDGFNGLIIAGEGRYQENDVPSLSAASGMDYAFSYCWYELGNNRPQQEYIDRQIEIMARWRDAGPIRFFPTASMGWDPLPWQNPNSDKAIYRPETLIRWLLSPDEYREVLSRTKNLMGTFAEDDLGRRLLVLDNWNEWCEGHYLAPHRRHGFGYLKAIREVFTACNNEPDYRLPDELGLGPYDSRYRRFCG